MITFLLPIHSRVISLFLHLPGLVWIYTVSLVGSQADWYSRVCLLPFSFEGKSSWALLSLVACWCNTREGGGWSALGVAVLEWAYTQPL